MAVNKIKLTTVQKEILSRIIDGLTISQIAQQMSYSKSSISYHIKKLYSIFDVQNRTALILKIMQKYYSKCGQKF